VYDLEISINYAGLTNKNLDYIFFKDAENDLFMLFGNENFIKKAMPISYEEYKVVIFIVSLEIGHQKK